jgi:hypothetical protein
MVKGSRTCPKHQPSRLFLRMLHAVTASALKCFLVYMVRRLVMTTAATKIRLKGRKRRNEVVVVVSKKEEKGRKLAKVKSKAKRKDRIDFWIEMVHY